MYFYVDESGNTGLHLFDPEQPFLFYGLLSSKVNVDALAEPTLRVLRKRLEVERIHAAELGIKRISSIADSLLELVVKYDIRFDFYRVIKNDYAVVQFFDQVFDQGMNPAVGWFSYWTPLRYALLLKVAALFDDDLTQRSWAARIERNDVKSDEILLDVCGQLLQRIEVLPDLRSRQLIGDALKWVSANPREISYNANRKDMVLAISPNLIGFQFVLLGIAHRLSNANRTVSAITVDLQQQFNGAQDQLASFYAKATGQVVPLGPGLPEMDLRNMPTEALSFRSSRDSSGLELVDVFIWLFKRMQSGSEFDIRTQRLMNKLVQRGRYDEMSLAAIDKRWSPFLLGDSRELTPEQIEEGSELMKISEERRLKALAGL